MRVVDRLGSLQFDPLEVAGRNHDLVLLSRVAGYRREWTDALLYDERRLYESYNKGLSLLPIEELPWHRLTWDRAGVRHAAEAFADHAPLVEELLTRIRESGPLSSTDVEPRPSIDWYWRPTNQVRAILEALAEAGRLGLARRQGNRRYYDLAERLFPADLLERRIDPHDQRRHRLLSRYRAHGMLGRSGSAELWSGIAPANRSDSHDGPTRGELLEELLAAEVLAPVRVVGVRGERFVLADELPVLMGAEAETRARPGAGDDDRSNAGDRGSGAGDGPNGAVRTLVSADAGLAGWSPIDGDRACAAFLAPLDPFVWDRDFLRRLFGFNYVWEVYVPEAKRQWGYYVLPILYGERLVGRIEPRIDRSTGSLEIRGLWWETGFDPLARWGFVNAFVDALDAHRRFADVRNVRFGSGVPRTPGQRRLAAEVRRRLADRPALPVKRSPAVRSRRPVGR